MYTIKQAAARTGVPIALLRAWERRYHVVAPERTASGYRLYSDDAIERIRTMRRLVDQGWSPSVAAAAILHGEVPPDARANAPADGVTRDGVAAGSTAPLGGDRAAAQELIDSFVDAAIALDGPGLEAALDRMFAAGAFEATVDTVLLPALGAIGDAWAADRLGVAGEHAASHAMLRRLSAAFQAAGRPSPSSGAILVGLPPAGRHELGALAFSVAARRAGLAVFYLGPDLPADDWLATATRTRPKAIVIGTPTAADVAPAIDVAKAVRSVLPNLPIAFGGRAAGAARDALGPSASIVTLPDRITDAVDALAASLRIRLRPA
jgi:DNA-binding transcriptional MerR regulator